jgi:hypothetical protein
MNTLRAAIATAVLIVTPSAYAQVRVIGPDTEHVYSAGGQLLDDEALRQKNARAETARRQREFERAQRERQEALDAELARLQAERDQAAANRWDAYEKARRRANGGTGF